MKSTVVKRSIVLAGHKTSISLEDAFWEGLKDIAKARRLMLRDLVGGIDIQWPAHRAGREVCAEVLLVERGRSTKTTG
jgi:predicted DNA-binding ribbon-helix-helix protein